MNERLPIMHFFFFFLFLITPFLSFSQYEAEVTTYFKTEEDFLILLKKNKDLRKNDTLCQRALDLVDPILADSVIPRKKERHHVFLVGWMINQLGYGWRAVSMKKEKFVGKVVRQSKSGEEQFTEFDINMDLNFHLPKYLFRVFAGYDMQRLKNRQDYRRGKHLRNYNDIPFVRDSANIGDISRYRLHAEHTPYRPFRATLHELFYPVTGKDMASHPNFRTNNPNVGMYGVFCLDCNHSCHPELHPYEWLWWMNLSADEDSAENKKTWNLGLLHEGSNRFPKWSPSPKTGRITIPFALDTRRGNPRIHIEHLIAHTFDLNALEKFDAYNRPYFGVDMTERWVNIKNDIHPVRIRLTQNVSLASPGIHYRLVNLNMDPDTRVLSGFLEIITSVKELYTTRITIQSEQGD